MATARREPSRKRDAAATRNLLLEAASDLFGTHGFANVSLRDIGERAGVDAALIARYFGNKVDLYLASLEADRLASDIDPAQNGLDAIARRILQRVDQHGLGPVMQAMLQPEPDSPILGSAAEYLRTWLIAPLASQSRDQGIVHPELHAEMTIAALVGIAHLRTQGLFPVLSEASLDDMMAWFTRLAAAEPS